MVHPEEALGVNHVFCTLFGFNLVIGLDKYFVL